MFNTKSTLRTLIAGAFLTIAASAQAAATFTVDPTAHGLASGTAEQFQADTLSGVSSARIQRVGTTDQYTSVGWIRYTAFSRSVGEDSIDVNPNTSGLLTQYNLYATFNQTFTCAGGLGLNVSCSIDSIDLSLYGDAGVDSVFRNATLGADAVVNPVGDQVLLGRVTGIISGDAGLSDLGGAFQNVNSNFALTPEGQAFFIAPDPFYTAAFSAFNNTSTGIRCSPTCAAPNVVAITQESGITDFDGLPTEVPEPGSLALMGLGLLGLGAYSRKRAQK